jgi:hypothetical protein
MPDAGHMFLPFFRPPPGKQNNHNARDDGAFALSTPRTRCPCQIHSSVDNQEFANALTRRQVGGDVDFELPALLATEVGLKDLSKKALEGKR